MPSDHRRKWLVLLVLFGINTVNFYDRQVLSAVTEPVRREWGLSDTEIGWLGTAFTLLYAFVGIPLGRAADFWVRKRILAIALAVWSGLTCASAAARGFGTLLAARLGIGAGEAACAPASVSMIGDLFQAGERARATSLFMAGLPVGISLSYICSGFLAQHYGWRSAFLIAGLPGLLLSVAAAFLPEPARGAADRKALLEPAASRSPYVVVLAIPTLWWIIASGALHNFAMYALSSFLPALVIRYHHASVETAGLLSGVIVGLVGASGMVSAGWLGDAWFRRRADGRMLLATLAAGLSVPASFLALLQPQGALPPFLALLGIAYFLLYMYYGLVYSTIQDVVAPSLRGTAMAIYFLAMYVFGASLGPVAAGWVSDSLARRAAIAANAFVPGSAIPEQFRAVGLHQAMFLVPAIGLLLTGVLYAGSRALSQPLRHRDTEIS
jgi:MFS family permease